MYQTFFKRFFDLTISLIAIILLSPLFILISILLAVNKRGTPFFLHARPGENGYNFAKENFDRNILAKKFIGHIESLVK